MSHTHLPRPVPALPDIVPIVLRQAYRHLVSGAIPRSLYDRQIERLTREELKPRGLQLEVAEVAPGHARFVISSGGLRTAQVIECGELE